MKNTLRTLTFILGLLLLSATVQAQTALNTTTLTTAITSTTPATVTLTVLSNTGATANTTGLWMNGEFFAVTATSGSTSITARRAQGGTGAVLHAANSMIWIGPQRAFTTVDPIGACTASTSGFTPFINVANRYLWNCINSTWQAFSPINMDSADARVSVPGNTPYLVQPTDYIVALSTTLQGCGCTATASPTNKSIVLPSHLGLAGKRLIIADESGGISATTSIILVGTVNGTHSSSINVVALKTPYSSVTLHAGSGGWFLDVCTQPQVTGVVAANQCR